MDIQKLYNYSEEQRECLERLVVPFAVFGTAENKLYTILVSDGLCSFFNETREELVTNLGNGLLKRIHKDDIQNVKKCLDGFLRDKSDYNCIYRTKSKSGNYRSVYAKGKKISSEDQQPVFIIWYSDLSEIRSTRSYYDELTGLPNMTLFRAMAQSNVEKMIENGVIPAFIYFDLRDMKAINEKYGFKKGDNVLRGTAYVLSETFAGNLVSRFAEDHFMVLTDKLSIEQKIETVYEQVLNNPIQIPAKICAGIYICSSPKVDVPSACDRARLACKSIKGNYNIKYREFDREMFDDYHRTKHILTHFEEAIRNRYIKVYYHSIVDANTRQICDIEALSRMFDPEKGIIYPSQFIPVLEEHRLISKLDFYMVEQVCRNIDGQRKNHMPIVPVSVNLSRIDFEICDVFENVLEITDRYKIPHNLLTIEITESAFIKNQNFLSYQIDRFRKAGFNVWMDDFGSEFSSLNTLQKFSFDTVKLDMKFMQNFNSDEKSHTILSKMVQMLSELGIETLAEGVQHEEQFDFLKQIGCNKVQGYLFSRPTPYEEFIKTNTAEALNG